jgi:hypothetical protein
MPILPRRTTTAAAIFLLLGNLIFAAPLLSPAAGNTFPDAGVDSGSGTYDPLWRKAVEIAAHNDGWIPGLAIQRVENMNGDWEVKDYEEFWVRITPDSIGEPHHELIKAIKDGEDRTEKERERAEKERRKAEQQQREEEARLRREAEARGEPYVEPEPEKYRILGGPLPFDPEVQDSISVRRIDAADPPPGPPSVAFEFTQPLSGEEALRGVVWLDAETGAPIAGRFVPDPLPGRVKEMEMRMRFESGPDGAWYPTELFIRAMGKFLFFKKRVQSTLTLSEHWWKEE